MKFIFFNEWKLYKHNGDIDVFSFSFCRYYVILTVLNFTFEINFRNN